jgi:hypothetical protein
MRLFTLAVAGVLSAASMVVAQDSNTPAPQEPGQGAPAPQDGEKKEPERPQGERRGRPGGERPRAPTVNAEEMLKRADKDGDGKLSKEEFLKDGYERFQERMAGGQGGGGPRGGGMSRLDTDGDGKVSYEEFCASPMAGERFTRLDKDSDGFLDRSELDAMAQEFGRRGRGQGQGPGEGQGRGGRRGQGEGRPPSGGEKPDEGSKDGSKTF